MPLQNYPVSRYILTGPLIEAGDRAATKAGEDPLSGAALPVWEAESLKYVTDDNIIRPVRNECCFRSEISQMRLLNKGLKVMRAEPCSTWGKAFQEKAAFRSAKALRYTHDCV